jgi:hypothetical protein
LNILPTSKFVSTGEVVVKGKIGIRLGWAKPNPTQGKDEVDLNAISPNNNPILNK